MKEQVKHIVIFSHGFGVHKDALGLFTDIEKEFSLSQIESILFDYNDYKEETKETFVKSFSEQTKILQDVIDTTTHKNPNAIIDIVGHSQGSVMAALADLKGIRKVISIAPFFHTDIHEVAERYNKFPESKIDFNGISRRARSNGTTTVIPPNYWAERFSTDVYALYNKLALATDLTIINAGEDKVMKGTDLMKVFNATIINIHGDHDFSKEYRPKLINVLKKVIN